MSLHIVLSTSHYSLGVGNTLLLNTRYCFVKPFRDFRNQIPLQVNERWGVRISFPLLLQSEPIVHSDSVLSRTCFLDDLCYLDSYLLLALFQAWNRRFYFFLLFLLGLKFSQSNPAGTALSNSYGITLWLIHSVCLNFSAYISQENHLSEWW